MPLDETTALSATAPSCTRRAALAGLAVAGAATLLGAPIAATASAVAPARQGLAARTG